MRTIRSIYHWSMVIFPLLGLCYLLGATAVMLIGGYSATSILWFMAMAYVAYHFMVLPAVRELRKFRKETRK